MLLFIGIRVESHFQQTRPSIYILLTSLLKLVAGKFILSTTEKSERLSGKSLHFVVRDGFKERLYESKLRIGQEYTLVVCLLQYWIIKAVDHLIPTFQFILSLKKSLITW